MSTSAKLISASRIRKLFNRGCYLKRFKENLFREKETYNKEPKDLPNGEPSGTHSIIIRCYDDNDNQVAVVHYYRRPDDSIGASGKPDPKRLSHKGRVYYTH